MNWEFGDAMRRLRIERDLSTGELAAAVNYDRSGLSRIERGGRLPTPRVTERIDTALRAGGSLVRLAEKIRSSTGLDIDREELAAAARESSQFAEWATGIRGDLDVDQISDELTSIGRQFVSATPLPLVGRLRSLRDDIRTALQAGPAPSRARDLILLGGITIDLLAHITENLGYAAAAERHARAAEAIGIELGHPGLQAWAEGTRALIWEWNHRPAEAMALAAKAAAIAPTGEQQVRLAAIEARCAARVGRAETAHDAITRAIEASEATANDEVTMFGGALRFPPSKAAYYFGSTHQLLGEYDQAQRWALAAISGYETGPPAERSYGDEALARADAAIGRIHAGELDGAKEILQPVLRLPSEQRIQPITDGLRAVDTALSSTHYANDKATIQFSEEINMLAPSRHPG
ncbi:helix-turn-helix domain-containing protein [Nocardia carnea]|uniref:helix-turn-helix domain-containing protein n=1 Tax=Nocardia carnea TaxID=37328 RepID=UPI000684B8B5|nr:helix-turn-helix transcriptional regulator [Nocardia carnea]